CVRAEDGRIEWQGNVGEKILINPVFISSKYLYMVTDESIYIFNRWGLLFTRHSSYSATGFTLSDNRTIFLCGKEGDIKNLRFKLE
ncbi:MAG: hypothetical protein PHF84_04390, partial [bacterium]|nr:hypothetical protein [bacterium]